MYQETRGKRLGAVLVMPYRFQFVGVGNLSNVYMCSQGCFFLLQSNYSEAISLASRKKSSGISHEMDKEYESSLWVKQSLFIYPVLLTWSHF